MDAGGGEVLAGFLWVSAPSSQLTPPQSPSSGKAAKKLCVTAEPHGPRWCLCGTRQRFARGRGAGGQAAGGTAPRGPGGLWAGPEAWPTAGAGAGAGQGDPCSEALRWLWCWGSVKGQGCVPSTPRPEDGGWRGAAAAREEVRVSCGQPALSSPSQGGGVTGTLSSDHAGLYQCVNPTPSKTHQVQSSPRPQASPDSGWGAGRGHVPGG